MTFADRTWFAAVTKPREESEARDRLMQQGFGAFLPMCLVRRSHAGKTETVERPLFPRYLFVGVGIGNAFWHILSTPGVAFVIRDAGGTALKVPVGVLQRIKDRCDRDGGAVNLVPEERGRRWKPGQRLRIAEGPLAGLEGCFVSSSKERVRVLIGLFGRMSEMEISLDAVCEVPGPE